MVTDIFGVDINSSWDFSNGDIELSSGQGNIAQAIYNRLSTDNDWYSDFYLQYGGELYNHLGDFNHPTIHEYIRIEIESILKQEHRIHELECTVNKTSNKEVECQLKITPVGSDEIIPLNLVLNDTEGIFIYTSELSDRRI